MKLKHWGQTLRRFYALVVLLPLGTCALVVAVGFSVINDLVDVAKRAILELSPEKGLGIANDLARLHVSAEFWMMFIPVLGGIALALANAVYVGRLFSRLTEQGARVVQSQDQMLKLSQQFKQTSEKVELSSQQSTSALDNTVVQLEVISSQLNKMATNVHQADKNARIAADASERCGSELVEVIQSLGHLIKQSKKLEEVVAVIESIAFQTNILAVNAAVEAARAGEQGRGFAIVAEAVRNLAQTSASSAKNISNLIRESGETSKRAIELISVGTEGMTATLELIRNSQRTIENVVSTNAELGDTLAKMSQSLTQLESSSHFFTSAADDTRKMGTEFSGYVSDLKKTSDELKSELLPPEGIVGVQASEALKKVVKPALTDLSAKKKRNEKSPQWVDKKTSMTKDTHGKSSSVRKDFLSKFKIEKKAVDTGTSRPEQLRASVKTRARDIIPFEGESESETHGDAKIGNISGF